VSSFYLKETKDEKSIQTKGSDDFNSNSQGRPALVSLSPLFTPVFVLELNHNFSASTPVGREIRFKPGKGSVQIRGGTKMRT